MSSRLARTVRSLAGTIVGAVVFGHPGGPVLAQETVALRGELLVAGRHLVDPPPADPKDSHAYVTLEGAAALRIYRSMPATAEADLCRGKGWRLKRAGGLTCSVAAGGRDGTCEFALDLRAGSLVGGRPC